MTAELRRDPISGRLVAIAPGRARRPGAGYAQIEPVTQEELDECPFCAGREDRTPPETLRLPPDGNWVVRVVPNLYPAVERQEVLIHSPRHARSFAELEDNEIDLVAQVVETHPDAFWLVNEGRAAGSSLPHSHSQLVYLDGSPPAVSAEEAEGVLEVLASAELVVAEDAQLRTVAHPAGRLPYELLIGGPGLRISQALRMLRDAVRRLRAVEGPVPWNAWLHRGAHPHIEVLPRLTVMAGLELGAGIYVNSLDPAEAAERLRNA